MKLRLKINNDFGGSPRRFCLDLCSEDGIRYGIITQPDSNQAGWNTRKEAVAAAKQVLALLLKDRTEIEL